MNRFETLSYIFFLSAIFFTSVSSYLVIPLLIISLFFLFLAREKISLNLLDKIQLTLFCSFLLSSAFAFYKLDSFIYTSVFLLYLVSYFMAKSLLNSEYSLKKLIDALLYSSLILSSIGVIQFLVQTFTDFTVRIKGFTLIASGRPIESLTTNPLHLVFFLNFTLPLFIIAIFKNYKKILASIATILSVFVLLITTLSTSRGAFVGFFCSLLLIFIILKKKIILLVIGFSVLFIFIAKPARVRFFHATRGTSYEMRVATNKAALKMWKEHSILTGVGGSNFHKLKVDYEVSGDQKLLRRTHNLYTSLLVENGILGLFIFLAIFGILIIYLYQIFKAGLGFQSIFSLGLLASFTYFLIHNMVSTTHDIVRFGILVWAEMGIVSAMRDTMY